MPGDHDLIGNGVATVVISRSENEITVEGLNLALRQTEIPSAPEAFPDKALEDRPACDC